jgi:AAHS family 4-hydroxybenzoate transporter-like MFS transporter
MSPPRTVNVAELVERGRMGRFQVAAFAVLAACLVMDGFDVQVLGYATPAIIEEWRIPKTDLTPVFGAGLLGLFLGSILGGMAADRWGRRPVLLAATAAFGVFGLLAAQAGSLQALLLMRLLSGLGLGAIMPNATALTGEYSPSRRRVATMMIVTNGFMVGAMLAGFLAAWLIPAHGWRALLLVGGVVPLVLLVPMAWLLPESLQFLAVRGQHPERIARWLRLVDPAAPAGEAVRYVASEEQRRSFSLAQLFRAGRTPGTLLLWALVAVAFLAGWGIFGGQPGVNALAATWYPTDLRSTGIGAALGVGRFGAILGPVVAGALMLRQWSTQELFQAAAIPAVASAALIFAMRWVIEPPRPGGGR